MVALQAYFNKAKIAAFGSALLPRINESGGNEKHQVMTNVLRGVDSHTLVHFHICPGMSVLSRNRSVDRDNWQTRRSINLLISAYATK